MTTRSRILFGVLAFAAAAVPLRADDVLFTFYGQVTDIQSFAQSQTAFHEGDPFAITLDFTPGGPTPAYGYCLTSGTTALSPRSIDPPIAPYGGLGPPFVDTYFSVPVNFSQYCFASVTLADNVLAFNMRDEEAGPWGSVTVGSDFPTAWFSDMTSPLPGNADSLAFSANGSMNFNFLNFGGTNITGTITSATISRDTSAGSSNVTPVPETASLAVLFLGVPALLRRRRRA